MAFLYVIQSSLRHHRPRLPLKFQFLGIVSLHIPWEYVSTKRPIHASSWLNYVPTLGFKGEGSMLIAIPGTTVCFFGYLDRMQCHSTVLFTCVNLDVLPNQPERKTKLPSWHTGDHHRGRRKTPNAAPSAATIALDFLVNEKLYSLLTAIEDH